MIDIQERSSTFKWVCLSLFILVTLFYFRYMEVRPHLDIFASHLFGKDYEEYPIFTYFYYACIGKGPVILGIRVFRDVGYVLVYEIVGIQYFHIAYRVLEVTTHLAVSISIFFLLKRLTTNTLVGISTAVLFAGFYIPSEALFQSWSFDDQTVCLFGLLSMIFYIRFFDGKGSYSYLLSLLFLLLAYLSKESGVIIFPAIFLLDLYLRKEAVKKGGPWKSGLSIKGIGSCIPFFLLSILYGVFILFYTRIFVFSNKLAGITEDGVISTVITWSFLQKLGLSFYMTLKDFFDMGIFPTPDESPGVKFIIITLIAATYFTSDKGFKRLLQLLACCGIILISSVAFFHLHIHSQPYIYLPVIFLVGLLASVMNQGAEKLSNLSLVQSFFIETPKRRLLAIMILCYLIIHFGLVLSSVAIYVYLFGCIRDAVLSAGEYSTIRSYILLFLAVSVLLGASVVYLRAGKEIKSFIHYVGLCTLVLMIPTFVPNFYGRDTYFIAALSMGLLACTVGYTTDILLTSRIVDFKSPRAVCLALLIFIHPYILMQNYYFVQHRTQTELISQKNRDLVAKPMRNFILQLEGYRGKTMHLLNFPYVGKSIQNYLSGMPTFTKFTDIKRVAAYCCMLELNAFDDIDIDSLTRKIVLNSFDLSKITYPTYYEIHNISAEEFNNLASDSNNKMLLLDNTTEQILDVSGMDFGRVQSIIADKEKQKAFVLP